MGVPGWDFDQLMLTVAEGQAGGGEATACTDQDGTGIHCGKAHSGGDW
ncbi:MAG: hypothetical protein JWO68_970 [Actinomycetia bacterium]|nr:hypothetical protein [Actinomycetes bacterium]